LAFIIEPSEFTSIKTAGACRWTAPEIMNPPEDAMSTNQSLALFTQESDIYAFGMTILEVCMSFRMEMLTGTKVYRSSPAKIPFSQKRNDSSVIFAVLGGGRLNSQPSLRRRKALLGLFRNAGTRSPAGGLHLGQ